MEIKLPNVPNLVGRAIGSALHIPIDVASGIKQGFTGKEPNESENEVDKPFDKMDATTGSWK